jgi:hypothetical protein
LTCASDLTVAACQTQVAVDAEYATWLGTASGSGGCNGVLTNNSTGAPDKSGGSKTVIFTYTSSCAPITTTCSATFTVNTTKTLSGTLKYNNPAQTPMNNVTLAITPGTATSITDIGGNYSFPGLCPGTYTIAVTNINKPAGGINSTDAAQVNQWGVAPYGIEKVRFFAGDVAGIGSPTGPDNNVNAADAGRILQYFVTNGTPPFNTTNWKFWWAGDMISANPYTGLTAISVAIGGSSITKDLFGECTGDFNRSFTPGGAKESASKTLFLTYGKTMYVKTGTEFDLPVYTESAMDVGAVSLIMNFPSDKLEILGVNLADQANTPVMFNVSGNELRIGWTSLDELSLKAADKLLTLRVKLVGSLGQDENIRFTLAENPLNELADAMANVVPYAVLNIDLIGTHTLGVNPPGITETLRFKNYPNPFTGTTTFVYSLPVAGDVSIGLRDMLGVRIKVILDKVSQTSGDYKLVLDANDLPAGVFMATLKFISDGQPMTHTIKIVRTY